jgi:hypothetical protein
MSHTEIIIAVVASNLVALVLLLLAWKKKNAARILFSILFLWAAFTNWKTVSSSPTVYLDYTKYAIDPYVWIINNILAENIQGYIYAIAAGQLMIGLGFLGRGLLVKISCIGGIIFFVAIAPLGLGSAFPFSITASIALYILYRHHFQKDIFKNKWWV